MTHPIRNTSNQVARVLTGISAELLEELRESVAHGAGHDCLEWIRTEAASATLGLPRACMLCDRTLDDIRGPKLATLEAVVLSFRIHGLEPYVAAPGPDGDPGNADLVVFYQADGAITEVRMTEDGLERLRRAAFSNVMRAAG